MLRPSRSVRDCMWLFTAFSVFFGLSSIVGFTLPEPEPGGGIMMMLAAAVFAATGTITALGHVERRADHRRLAHGGNTSGGFV